MNRPHARRPEEDRAQRPSSEGPLSEGFSYYETLGGGQGACPDANGPSGVHVAMSNTLNTPIEALEREFPLRAIEYALRRDSGRRGRPPRRRWVVRELQALREMTFSLIAERRRRPARRKRRVTACRGPFDRRSGDHRQEHRPTASRSRLRIEDSGGGGSARPEPPPGPRLAISAKNKPICRRFGFPPGFRIPSRTGRPVSAGGTGATSRSPPSINPPVSPCQLLSKSGLSPSAP